MSRQKRPERNIIRLMNEFWMAISALGGGAAGGMLGNTTRTLENPMLQKMAYGIEVIALIAALGAGVVTKNAEYYAMALGLLAGFAIGRLGLVKKS